jgi:hypothetical protein
MKRRPDSVVMTLPDRRRYDYRYSNYASYWTSEKVPFPVEATDAAYHPKEVVLGVLADGKSRAYVGSILTSAGSRIVDEFEGRKLRIVYDGESGSFVFEAPEDVEVTSAYWFAWKAFHPDTEIWHAAAGSDSPAPTGTSPGGPSE